MRQSAAEQSYTHDLKMFLKYYLSSRIPKTQSILVQRQPPSATLRQDYVGSRERGSWCEDPGGEERGYGRVLCLHQQCGWFCLLLCSADSSEYVCNCLNYLHEKHEIKIYQS